MGAANEHQPTGNVYRFSTFQELVDRVPGDRIPDCLEELGTVLGMAKLTSEMMIAMVESRNGVQGPIENENGDRRVMAVPEEFEWIDDGKRDLAANLCGLDGKPLMSVNVVKNTES